MQKLKFLFDLGNVFFDWNPKHFYKKIFLKNDELNHFLSNICNDEWNILQDAGRPIKDAEDILIKQHPAYEKEIKLYYKNHRKMIKSTYLESINLLYELKFLGYENYVLSNWSAETFIGIIKEYPFLNNFNDMIISGNEKICKPNPLIYKLAIKRFSLNPAKTIFIDDRIENINSAKKLNFETIHLTNPNLIKELVLKKLKELNKKY